MSTDLKPRFLEGLGEKEKEEGDAFKAGEKETEEAEEASGIEMILMTGSEGLIGRGLQRALRADGHAVRRLDHALYPGANGAGNLLDPEALGHAFADPDLSGVVHLAAVSRVLWGERDPDLCWRTNAIGTQAVLNAALRHPRQPWVLFASSREVYGQPAALPVREDAPLVPVNIYGRTKAAAEGAVLEARDAGLATAIVRLSNVYGCVADHPDRVVPAFARGAAQGTPLRVDGAAHAFDFTHVDDTVKGLLAVLAQLQAHEARLPTIHLVTGQPTTLGRLAELAFAASSGRCAVVDGPPREFDVARFVGDPARAEALLGWRARIQIEEGLPRLAHAFAARADEAAHETWRELSPHASPSSGEAPR